MTNHVGTREISHSPSRSFAGWRTILRNWRARRHVRALQDRSDSLLYDIGVTRDEVAWASGLPLTANAAKELDRAAYDRRKREALQWL